MRLLIIILGILIVLLTLISRLRPGLLAAIAGEENLRFPCGSVLLPFTFTRPGRKLPQRRMFRKNPKKSG